MKRMVFAVALLVVSLMILISLGTSIQVAKANADYSITLVNHAITVAYNGYIFINDTITLNTTSGQAPTDFLVGFPFAYGKAILECRAYNASDTYDVVLDVPLENRVEFYAVKVDFGSRGAPPEFNVDFVFSNRLIKQNPGNSSQYLLSFPAYPSLDRAVADCKVSLILPREAVYVGGNASGFSFGKQNLQPFSFQPSDIIFYVPNNKIQLATINELNREIGVNELGDIKGSDMYVITSNSSETMNFFDVAIPLNATDPFPEDQFGRTMDTPSLIDASLNRYRINLTLPLEPSNSTRFTVRYTLPKQYLTVDATNNLVLSVPTFQNVNYYVEKASVAFSLPEGARLLNSKNTLIGSSYIVTRGIFEEKVAVMVQGVTSLDSTNVEIQYWYNPLWLSFRPTLWVLCLAIVGCAVMIIWKRPKAVERVSVPTVALKRRPESIRAFVDSYGEKQKIMVEMDSLEVNVHKGRIPRRRYKVRKKILETRLDTLSRSLEELKEQMRGAGGHYGDLMRQLEIAETETTEAENNIKSIESRHGRGELSLEAYRKLLGDYQRKKDNARTTINGILLRLREETR